MKKLQKQILITSLIMLQLLVFIPEAVSGYNDNEQVITSTDLSTTYNIVDTGETICYDNMYEISYPLINESFYGQDANYMGNHPHYQDNGDGTVTDLITGLMWQQTPDEKQTYVDIVANADDYELAGYDDWRLPTIKELYSLIDFSGSDPSGVEDDDTSSLTPFIDTNYFTFEYGDPAAMERIIDAQYASSTTYVAEVINEDVVVFGVNFADGRIKGYGTGSMPGQPTGKLFTVIHVRGNEVYGVNNLIDNLDGTITDNATTLMWAGNDSGSGMNWEEALDWVQEMNDANYLGYNDWCLPNVKELQSIVDYTRSPNTTNSAAIDPLFNCTVITNEAGQDDYAFYWSGTTHATSSGTGGFGCYVAFGRSLGYSTELEEWIDVHGAGSQRSDPKMGDAADYPYGHGPQGDAIRIDNYVRLVRGGVAEEVTSPDDYPTYFTPSVGFSTIFAIISLVGLSTLLLIIRKRK